MKENEDKLKNTLHVGLCLEYTNLISLEASVGDWTRRHNQLWKYNTKLEL